MHVYACACMDVRVCLGAYVFRTCKLYVCVWICVCASICQNTDDPSMCLSYETTTHALIPRAPTNKQINLFKAQPPQIKKRIAGLIEKVRASVYLCVCVTYVCVSHMFLKSPSSIPRYPPTTRLPHQRQHNTPHTNHQTPKEYLERDSEKSNQYRYMP